jgi:hypothetical protein
MPPEHTNFDGCVSLPGGHWQGSAGRLLVIDMLISACNGATKSTMLTLTTETVGRNPSQVWI